MRPNDQGNRRVPGAPEDARRTRIRLTEMSGGMRRLGLESELEHYGRSGGGRTAGRFVQSQCSGIRAVGEHPRNRTTHITSEVQDRVQHLPTNPLLPMFGRNANFVDPKLGGLIRVDIVHGTRKSNDLPRVDRDNEMMPWIVQELGGELRIHRVVEDPWRNVE